MVAAGAEIGFADPRTISSKGACRERPDGTINTKPEYPYPPGAIQFQDTKDCPAPGGSRRRAHWAPEVCGPSDWAWCSDAAAVAGRGCKKVSPTEGLRMPGMKSGLIYQIRRSHDDCDVGAPEQSRWSLGVS